MAAGKWIPELTAETAVADAARLALAVRFQVVREYLQLAMQEPDRDPEHVHQLRVGTRRATAALDLFARCLSEKQYRRARKGLRLMRRAAGEARDWDVFLIDLLEAKRRSARQAPGVDLLAGFALGRRSSAQAQLNSCCPEFPFSFERLQAETVAAVHRPRSIPEPRTLLDLARPILTGLLQKFHEAASGNLDDYDHLHQVRILGKQLRYAMELFADCFAPEFKEQHYPRIEAMQDLLGRANDSHVAIQRLADIQQRLVVLRAEDAKRYRPAFTVLTRQHKERLLRERENFAGWWQTWRESGQETALLSLLKQDPENANHWLPPETANQQLDGIDWQSTQ